MISRTKHLKEMLISLLFLLSATAVFAQSSRLHAPVKLEANGIPIDVETTYSCPTLHDLDGDGDLDLISGDFNGHFRVFNNLGSDENPVYDNYYLLQAGGENARVPVH